MHISNLFNVFLTFSFKVSFRNLCFSRGIKEENERERQFHIRQASWGGFELRSTHQDTQVFMFQLKMAHEIRRGRPQMWLSVEWGQSSGHTATGAFPTYITKLVADWNRAASYSWRGCMVKRAQCCNSHFTKDQGQRNMNYSKLFLPPDSTET